jgi:diguanylate cyclase (GGDEF)-like protein
LLSGRARFVGSLFSSTDDSRAVSAGSWRTRTILPGLLVACVGIALSLGAWFAVSVRENRLAEIDFVARAKGHALVMQNEINDQLEKVSALRAFFQASDDVTRREFTTFSESILEGRAAILAMSWIPRISHGERVAHEQAAIRDGIAGYHVKSLTAAGLVPSAVRDEYFPMAYSTRELAGSPVYGLDLNDGGLRQATLERARDHDRMATSPYFGLQVGAGDRNGFFVVLPVYRHGLPHTTLEERRVNLLGYVQGVFQTAVLIDTILRTAMSPVGLDLYWFASDAAYDAPPLHFHSSRMRKLPSEAQPRASLASGLHWSSEISVGDRAWTFVAAPIPGGPGTASRIGSSIILIGGLLLSALAALYIWASGRHAARMRAANRNLDRANARLGEQNARFAAALGNVSQAILMFDAAGRLVMSNQRYCEMYDLPPDVTHPGCTIRDLLDHRQRRGTLSDDPETYCENLLSTLAEGRIFQQFAELPDGRTIAIMNHPMKGGGWVATHEDITERRRAEAKISYMARHDSLTDLPNRLLFHEQLEQALARTARGGALAVLCLDIDHFKGVNDTLGHPIGDLLLKAVAARVRDCMRGGDAVARLGGDEFAIVQTSGSQPTDATALAARVIETVGTPFELDGHQVIAGMSIGIAISPDDGTDPFQLLKNADMALYRAKSDGRGVYRFFEPEMDARMQARRTLELDLRKAIAQGDFELHYQPIVDIRTRQVRGFEALVRWRHPQRGIVPPLDFIPLAEETGLIMPLGEWVLRHACTEAASWPGQLSVAVNLSPVQFKNKNLVSTVMMALSAAGLAPSRLELEITESVLLQESEATLAMLHQLRSFGVKISMDDFGTGYSSLGYLRKFPFDKIKIDRSFISGMSDGGESLAIVRAVAAIGGSLGIVTTAEGVETSEQFERLKAEGCTQAQGYFISPPRPAAELRGLLASLHPNLKAIA